MSSAYHLIISNYPVLEDYSEVGQYLLTLFREEDKHIFERSLSERNAIAWGEPREGDYEERENAVEYRSTVGNLRQRLDVMGFTLQKAKNDLETGIKEKVKRQEEFLARTGIESIIHEELQAEIDMTRMITYENWLVSIREIFSRNSPSIAHKDYSTSPNYPFIKLILNRGMYDILSLFGQADFRSALRALLEGTHQDAEVVLDLTEVILAGYHDAEDKICEQALASFSYDYTESAKIIILAEGSTDIAFIDKSLRTLYPHLHGYYSFMDFHTPNMPGSASALVTTIKAFIGSGIQNRLIALFDNDTAGNEALRALALITLPKNIKILTLPPLDFAKFYPTLGPYGHTPIPTDINGLACSIEMYFGRDILLDDSGAFIPVQWRGYSEGLRQYQGEIQKKKELQERYNSFVAQALQEPPIMGTHDWQPMDIVLKHIFQAFN